MKRSVAIFITFLMLILGLFAWANWPYTKLPENIIADYVVVYKKARKMQLLSNEEIIREYTISLGADPSGHKQQEGDERTPEGIYSLDWSNPDSFAYLSMHISYPNSVDKDAAKAANRNPGGMIMVHGIRNGFGWLGRLHRLFDWTDGCIALTNPEMAEFWRVVPVGTSIEIRP